MTNHQQAPRNVKSTAIDADQPKIRFCHQCKDIAAPGCLRKGSETSKAYKIDLTFHAGHFVVAALVYWLLEKWWCREF